MWQSSASLYCSSGQCFCCIMSQCDRAVIITHYVDAGQTVQKLAYQALSASHWRLFSCAVHQNSQLVCVTCMCLFAFACPPGISDFTSKAHVAITCWPISLQHGHETVTAICFAYKHACTGVMHHSKQLQANCQIIGAHRLDYQHLINASTWHLSCNAFRLLGCVCNCCKQYAIAAMSQFATSACPDCAQAWSVDANRRNVGFAITTKTFVVFGCPLSSYLVCWLCSDSLELLLRMDHLLLTVSLSEDRLSVYGTSLEF